MMILVCVVCVVCRSSSGQYSDCVYVHVCVCVCILIQGVPNDSWRLTKINDKFELCDTYPALVSCYYLCLSFRKKSV